MARKTSFGTIFNSILYPQAIGNHENESRDNGEWKKVNFTILGACCKVSNRKKMLPITSEKCMLLVNVMRLTIDRKISLHRVGAHVHHDAKKNENFMIFMKRGKFRL